MQTSFMLIVRYHARNQAYEDISQKRKIHLKFIEVNNFLNLATRDKKTKSRLLNISRLSLDDEPIKVRQ